MPAGTAAAAADAGTSRKVAGGVRAGHMAECVQKYDICYGAQAGALYGGGCIVNTN